ncbi:MAG: molybdenum cofactor guanylyltransferase [Prolixibacteraceae bacterium]
MLLTGIVLAGGKSSRMGQEKGLIHFRGKPLIQFGIELLCRFSDRILISSNNSGYLQFGYELVPDLVSGLGPAAGLAATLTHSETTWNIVIGCDLPFLEVELIDLMLEKANGNQAVIPVHNGVMEPLAGLYTHELGPYFEEAVSSGNFALHKILANCKVHYFETSMLLGKYPKLFSNFNSLKEMQNFID